MALHIAEKDWGGVTVLALSGRVVLGEESSQLRNKIKAVLGQGKKHIVLDLGDITYIDSAGLGTLVAGYTTASSQGNRQARQPDQTVRRAAEHHQAGHGFRRA